MIERIALVARSAPDQSKNLGLIEQKLNQLIERVNIMQRTFSSEWAIESAARTATFNTDIELRRAAIGAVFTLTITAASGTSPTLDVKIQRYDPLTETYHDVDGGAFAQKTGTGDDQLVIYPGIAETANKAVNDVLTHSLRIVSTIGGTTPSFTFSLGIEPLG